MRPVTSRPNHFNTWPIPTVSSTISLPVPVCAENKLHWSERIKSSRRSIWEIRAQALAQTGFKFLVSSLVMSPEASYSNCLSGSFSFIKWRRYQQCLLQRTVVELNEVIHIKCLTQCLVQSWPLKTMEACRSPLLCGDKSVFHWPEKCYIRLTGRIMHVMGFTAVFWK